jgi:hypothetical protein
MAMGDFLAGACGVCEARHGEAIQFSTNTELLRDARKDGR